MLSRGAQRRAGPCAIVPGRTRASIADGEPFDLHERAGCLGSRLKRSYPRLVSGAAILSACGAWEVQRTPRRKGHCLCDGVPDLFSYQLFAVRVRAADLALDRAGSTRPRYSCPE